MAITCSLTNIEIDGPVGIAKTGKGDLGIRIYPNPSVGIFNLYIEKGNKNIDISIFDLHGQKVYTEKTLGKERQHYKRVESFRIVQRGLLYPPDN